MICKNGGKECDGCMECYNDDNYNDDYSHISTDEYDGLSGYTDYIGYYDVY